MPLSSGSWARCRSLAPMLLFLTVDPRCNGPTAHAAPLTDPHGRAPLVDATNTCMDNDSSICPMRKQSHGRWNWNPEKPHRCNVQVVSYEQVFDMFGTAGLPPLYPRPLVIRDDLHNSRLQELTRRDTIVSSFPPHFNVTLSSSNTFSAHRRTIPLTQYLSELEHDNGETTPDQLSNETWYLFGETYSEEWQTLLQHYHLPPCQTCAEELTALSFGIGNRGSGVQWHSHGPGFSQALHGRKHWVLSPSKPNFHPDYTSRHWMEYTYTAMPEAELPDECTLEPGDLLYFPDAWYHATINLDLYTAFVSAFTTEHALT